MAAKLKTLGAENDRDQCEMKDTVSFRHATHLVGNATDIHSVFRALCVMHVCIAVVQFATLGG
jgi:hypothetical protein